jgi:AcrR family transcriptional regulator
MIYTDRSVCFLERKMSRQQRGEETRAQLVQAAARAFAEQGYDATSVAEICQRAGVSKGAFYHHFDSKQDLFLDLLDFWLRGLVKQLEVARLGASTMPGGLIRMAEEARIVFEMAGQYVPIFLEFFAQARRDPEVLDRTVEPYRTYRSFFARLIQVGIDDGSLRQIDPDLAAQVILSMAIGLLWQSVHYPAESDWGDVAVGGVRLLLEGLERDARWGQPAA